MKTASFYFVTPIKAAMRKKQIKTTRQLSELTEGRVSQSTVSRLLRRRTGHRKSVEVVCEVLGIDIRKVEDHTATAEPRPLNFV